MSENINDNAGSNKHKKYRQKQKQEMERLRHAEQSLTAENAALKEQVEKLKAQVKQLQKQAKESKSVAAKKDRQIKQLEEQVSSTANTTTKSYINPSNGSFDVFGSLELIHCAITTFHTSAVAFAESPGTNDSARQQAILSSHAALLAGYFAKQGVLYLRLAMYAPHGATALQLHPLDPTNMPQLLHHLMYTPAPQLGRDELITMIGDGMARQMCAVALTLFNPETNQALLPMHAELMWHQLAGQIDVYAKIIENYSTTNNTMPNVTNSTPAVPPEMSDDSTANNEC